MKTIIFLILFSLPSLGGELWVTSSNLTTRESLQKLADKSRDGFQELESVSFFNIQIAHPLSSDELKKVLNQEESALKLSLSGNFKEALRIHEALLSDLEKAPNVSGVEKIVFSTLLKIAEVKSLLKSPDAPLWWRRAHGFSPSGNLNPEDFSPASRGHFHSLDKIFEPQKFEVRAAPVSNIYIDGRRIHGEAGIFMTALEPGLHQVAALAPGSTWYLKQVSVVDGENAPLTIPLEPAVTGTCEHPVYLGKPLGHGVKLLAQMSEDCERVFDGEKWFTLEKRVLEMYLPTQNFKFSGLEAPVEHTWMGKVVRSPWFWVGVTAVTAGVIYAVKQNQQTETVIVPTHTLR